MSAPLPTSATHHPVWACAFAGSLHVLALSNVLTFPRFLDHRFAQEDTDCKVLCARPINLVEVSDASLRMALTSSLPR